MLTFLLGLKMPLGSKVFLTSRNKSYMSLPNICLRKGPRMRPSLCSAASEPSYLRVKS